MDARPTRGSSSRATATDIVRQVFVAGSAIVAMIGLAVGVGSFGDNAAVEQSAGGALSDAATLVAPAGPAFSIWTPIYIGLAALAVWQLAPSRRADPRLRRVGWLIGLTMLLNAAWLFVVEADLLLLSAVVIVVLLAALVLAYVPLFSSRPATRLEAVLLDGTMGVYTGWVTAATIANIAAVLVGNGAGDLGLGATTWAALMIAVATGVGVFVAVVSRGRLAYGLALAWALAWVSFGRAAGSTQDTLVAVVAAGAALVVVAATVSMRARAAGSSRMTGQRTPAVTHSSG